MYTFNTFSPIVLKTRYYTGSQHSMYSDAQWNEHGFRDCATDKSALDWSAAFVCYGNACSYNHDLLVFWFVSADEDDDDAHDQGGGDDDDDDEVDQCLGPDQVINTAPHQQVHT